MFDCLLAILFTFISMMQHLTEPMEKKIDEAGVVHEDDHTRTTRKTLLKMRRSFDLNHHEEPPNKEPMRKTKSLNSHFLVNIDELINSTVTPTFHEEDNIVEIGLLSVYESIFPSQTIHGPSLQIDEEDPGPCSHTKIQIEPAFGISLKVNYPCIYIHYFQAQTKMLILLCFLHCSLKMLITS